MSVDSRTLERFEESLRRCFAHAGFLDRFYELFLASSPKVAKKFANTDFTRQKDSVRSSFQLIVRAAQDNSHGAERQLEELAERHSSRDLDIGAELYDLWLDSLVQAARESDPEFTPEVEAAWERVLGVGIKFMLSRY